MCEPGLQFTDLLLLDDVLPLDFAPFRTLEYGHYLEFFNAILLSLEGWRVHIGNDTFSQALAALPIEPSRKSRICRFNEGHGITGRLAYVTFLHNAAALLPYFTERKLPFIVQLYPGGGFNLEQAETDEQLRQVLLSPLCRKVIVTQTISQRYITETIGCDPDKLEFIYGGVFESRIDFDFLKDKALYGRDKHTLDLCFVAHRYGNNLAAKGYEPFVAVARALAAEDQRLRFHVVGDYTAEDLPLGDAAARFTFYGRRPGDFFQTFYPRMDGIISLTRPFAQGPGAFDGFPTGSCIEAGFRGVLNCINDPLGLNIAFSSGRDIVLLDDKPEQSIASLRELLAAPPRLYDLAYANWRQFHEVFDVNRQLWSRTRTIVQELVRPEALIVRPRPRPSGLDGLTDNVLSYLHDQRRNQADWVYDIDRRHRELLRRYREQEQQRRERQSEQVVGQTGAEALNASRETSATDSLRMAWRTHYDRLRARIGRYRV